MIDNSDKAFLLNATGTLVFGNTRDSKVKPVNVCIKG